MANIASQEKRNRQNARREHRNKAWRSMLKTHMKKFDTAAATGDRTSASEAYRVAARHLDRASTRGIIDRNYAANKKSKMAKRLGSLS